MEPFSSAYLFTHPREPHYKFLTIERAVCIRVHLILFDASAVIGMLGKHSISSNLPRDTTRTF